MKALPEPVIEAIGAYWSGYLAIPPVTLGDTLLLAEELATVPSPLHKLGGSGERSAANFELILEEESLSNILAESAEIVASLTQALSF